MSFADDFTEGFVICIAKDFVACHRFLYNFTAYAIAGTIGFVLIYAIIILTLILSAKGLCLLIPSVIWLAFWIELGLNWGWRCFLSGYEEEAPLVVELRI